MQLKFSKKDTNLKKARFHINPEHYWKVTFYIALLIALTGCAFGLYLFSTTSSDFTLGENTQSSVETINKKGLEESIQYFDDKREKSESILVNPSPIIDPSL
jgi:hypothetical protein